MLRGAYTPLSGIPQYLVVNLLTFGFVLYGPRLIDFVAWVNLIFVHLILAEREEGQLQEKFGKEYLEYKKRVPFTLSFISYRLRRLFGGRYPSLKRKAVLTAIYLFIMANLITVIWIAWTASGGLLMK